MPLDRTRPTAAATPDRWGRLCTRLGRFCRLLHAAHRARVPF